MTEATENTVEATLDESLMEQWLLGEASAFDSLYERYRVPLWQYVINRCDREAEARELFQDVWMRVAQGRESYTHGAPFKAWLFRIAMNRMTDHYRRHTSSRETTYDESTGHAITEIGSPLRPDEIAAIGESSDLLQKALTQLPDVQREAIVLQHIAGMTLAEIAQHTGEATETVKSRLRYAKTKLRQLLRAST